MASQRKIGVGTLTIPIPPAEIVFSTPGRPDHIRAMTLPLTILEDGPSTSVSRFLSVAAQSGGDLFEAMEAARKLKIQDSLLIANRTIDGARLTTQSCGSDLEWLLGFPLNAGESLLACKDPLVGEYLDGVLTTTIKTGKMSLEVVSLCVRDLTKASDFRLVRYHQFCMPVKDGPEGGVVAAVCLLHQVDHHHV